MEVNELGGIHSAQAQAALGAGQNEFLWFIQVKGNLTKKAKPIFSSGIYERGKGPGLTSVRQAPKIVFLTAVGKVAA